ncbi:polymer-forming cytoskeletal protein [Gillisia sp. M10.2A]|uniref:Polymer-forming cytoskeletal protein n=1 Tax=Gillisia lutea TaxID=2909668 RepID=A0ABS9EGU9_9FLAO|nr:polymer-forming cytoskeletal protein [Gillisia lutea]MCF4100668.1 polymer-forming cytoskeletal protein [Gillisia lutea]
MFSNQKNSKFSTEISKEQNRISAGTIITGDIEAKGGFRIEGTLKGTLKTAGKVVISKGGFIEGTLDCQNADFEGKFSGKLLVSETLTLRNTAVVNGEVKAGKLAIEPGANFNATCEMKGAVKSLNKNEQKETERTA